MHFLLTRPEQDSHRLAHSLMALGHRVTCEPLLNIEFAAQPEINLARFQAVLFTSANGMRAFAHNSRDRDILCYTVGDATAAEARQAGFHMVHSAAGNVETLAELVIRERAPDTGPLLHISGTDVAGNLSGALTNAGFQVTRRKLYTATKAPAFSQKAQTLITSGEVTHIPFYSPRTAQIFVTLARSARLEDHLTKTTALCLSSAVSNVIRSLSWHRILTAEHPDQYSLLQLIDIKIKENRQ